MARVADEPRPTPARAFARSLRHLALRDAAATLLTAWRLAFEPSRPVSASTRAASAALFLSVVIVVGIGGSLLASGGLALLGEGDPVARPVDVGATPSESPVVELTPTPVPTLAPTPVPSLAPTPAPTPAVERPSPTDAARATPTPEPPADREDAGDAEREDPKKEKRETPEPRERERDDEDHEDDD